MAISAAMGGWFLMVLVGVVWHEFGVLRPIGFWLSCVLALLVRMVLGGSVTK